jgi:hypothetical protein
MTYQIFRYKLLLEVLWMLLSGIFCTLFFLPFFIYNISFPFFDYNFFYIMASFHLTRWIFAIRYSFFAHQVYLKILTIFISIAVFLLAYRGMNLYQLFIDENGYYHLFEHLELTLRYKLAFFINSQFFFFGVWTMVSSLVFPFILIRSIWRVRNIGEE